MTKSCARRKAVWFEGHGELVRRVPLVDREAYDHEKAYELLPTTKTVKPILRCKLYCLTDGIKVKKSSRFGQNPPRKFYPYKDIHRFYSFEDHPDILIFGCVDPDKDTKTYDFFRLDETHVQELCQLLEKAHGDCMYRLVDGESSQQRYQSSQSSLTGDTDTIQEEADGQKAIDEVDGQKAIDEVDGQKAIDEVDGQKAIDDVDGQKAIDEVDGQKAIDEVDGQKAIDDVDGQKAIDEVDGQKAIDEIATTTAKTVQPEDVTNQVTSVDSPLLSPDECAIEPELVNHDQSAPEEVLQSPLSRVPEDIRRTSLFKRLYANLDENELLAVDMKYIEPHGKQGNQIVDNGGIYLFVAHHKHPEPDDRQDGNVEWTPNLERTAESGFTTIYITAQSNS
ncbi:Circumsporozoite protein [Fasciolopsis buskii]|uniref:Circumsporozoite protein n=1 Tax=Fasciolopsis buskii TaxID=27845 RepID=A0A8E0RTC9_9TREM|nr:Circumsporozoite protein [Fasciolopsis buski]